MLERIQILTAPCKCGCKGTDPWHRSTFKRAIRDMELVTEGPEYDKGLRARGNVQLPWGMEAVEKWAYETGVPDEQHGYWRLAKGYLERG